VVCCVDQIEVLILSAASRGALVATTPLGGRFGRPEEIAPAVVFLVSDNAAWLTGERLNTSGRVH
jgi:3-oxoacyl-[acyl-carrier protein] reductase